MATLDSIIRFTGKLGNIIAYKRGGKHFLRTRPETVRQTEGTRRAAQWFGAASRKGALIRNAIMPDLDFRCEGSLVNRMNRNILQGGRNHHAAITGFRFNPHTGIEKFFQIPPIFSKNGQLEIPAQTLSSPEGAKTLDVKLIATRIDFANRKVVSSDADMLQIDLSHPFNGAFLSINAPGKGTLVITLQVQAFREDGICHNRKHMAADILAVIEDRAPDANFKVKPSRKTAAATRSSRSRKLIVSKSHFTFIQRE